MPSAEAVWLVMQGGAHIAIDTAHAIAVVNRLAIARGIHRDLEVVHTQAVASGVSIREQTRLQHAIGREADAWYHGGR